MLKLPKTDTKFFPVHLIDGDMATRALKAANGAFAEVQDMYLIPVLVTLSTNTPEAKVLNVEYDPSSSSYLGEPDSFVGMIKAVNPTSITLQAIMRTNGHYEMDKNFAYVAKSGEDDYVRSSAGVIVSQKDPSYGFEQTLVEDFRLKTNFYRVNPNTPADDHYTTGTGIAYINVETQTLVDVLVTNDVDSSELNSEVISYDQDTKIIAVSAMMANGGANITHLIR